jgi:hypothetical protein
MTPDGLPLLNYGKCQIGKLIKRSIVLKNEGYVPATVKFDPITH